MALKTLIYKVAGCVTCGEAQRPLGAGQVVDLQIDNTNIPGLPTEIRGTVSLATQGTVQITQPSGAISSVPGFTYHVVYDNVQLNGIMLELVDCAVLGIQCVMCCDILQEQINRMDVIDNGNGTFSYRDKDGIIGPTWSGASPTPELFITNYTRSGQNYTITRNDGAVFTVSDEDFTTSGSTVTFVDGDSTVTLPLVDLNTVVMLDSSGNNYVPGAPAVALTPAQVATLDAGDLVMVRYPNGYVVQYAWNGASFDVPNRVVVESPAPGGNFTFNAVTKTYDHTASNNAVQSAPAAVVENVPSGVQITGANGNSVVVSPAGGGGLVTDLANDAYVHTRSNGTTQTVPFPTMRATGPDLLVLTNVDGSSETIAVTASDALTVNTTTKRYVNTFTHGGVPTVTDVPYTKIDRVGSIVTITDAGGVTTTFNESPGSAPPLVANDSLTIDFTTSGVDNHTVTGSIVGSATATTGQSPVSNGAGGITWQSPTPLTGNDTATIDLTTSGTDSHTLSATLVGSPTATTGQVPTSNGAGGIVWSDPRRPFVVQGQLSATNSTSVLETDNIWHTGKVAIGTNTNRTGVEGGATVTGRIDLRLDADAATQRNIAVISNNTIANNGGASGNIYFGTSNTFGLGVSPASSTNVAIGFGALNSAAASFGSDNTYIGGVVGYGPTAPGVTNRSTVVGAQSGYGTITRAVTVGSYCLGLGTQTQANSNFVAVGDEAAKFGNINLSVAVGANALMNNAPGNTKNVAVGISAGSQLGSATGGSMIGQENSTLGAYSGGGMNKNGNTSIGCNSFTSIRDAAFGQVITANGSGFIDVASTAAFGTVGSIVAVDLNDLAANTGWAIATVTSATRLTFLATHAAFVITVGVTVYPSTTRSITNSTTVGCNAQPTRSHQVTLGNSATLEVFTTGKLIANIPSYANDAAADADATLLSGSLYKVGRAVFQKP